MRSMKKYWLLLIIFLAFDSALAQQELSLSLDLGQSRDGIDIYRLGAHKPLGNLYRGDNFVISGYHEVSLNHWRGTHDRVFGVAYSPVFSITVCNDCPYKPYIEGGIGVSLISDSEIENRDMSSLFQFEDRIGVGIRSSSIAVHLDYLHYSNAGLVEPNEGIDIFIAGVVYAF